MPCKQASSLHGRSSEREKVIHCKMRQNRVPTLSIVQPSDWAQTYPIGSELFDPGVDLLLGASGPVKNQGGLNPDPANCGLHVIEQGRRGRSIHVCSPHCSLQGRLSVGGYFLHSCVFQQFHSSQIPISPLQVPSNDPNHNVTSMPRVYTVI